MQAFVAEVMAPRSNLTTVKGIGTKFDLLGRAGAATNGNGETGKECCRILTQLTLQSQLDRLTMQFSAGFLSPRGLLSPFQRWCPRCLSEMEVKSRVLHYPLAWHLAAVDFCPIHKMPLRNNCPHCGKRHYPLSRRSRVGDCPHCGCRLLGAYLDSEKSGSDDIEAFSAFAATEVMKLIASVRHPDCAKASQWSQNIRQAIASNFGGTALRFARQFGFNRASVVEWAAGNQLPTLHSALRVAYGLGVGLMEFLTKDQEADVLSPEDQHRMATSRRHQHRQERLDLGAIKAELVRAKDAPGFPPPSLAEVCRRVGCHQSFADKKFPELTKPIKDLYRTYQRTRKEQRHFFTRLVVKAAAAEIAVKGDYPSHRRMREKLPRSMSLMDPVAHRAWAEELEHWGLRVRRPPAGQS